MPKQVSASTSNAAASSSRPPPFKQKTIQSTEDLKRSNTKAKAKGKGKERAVLGEVADLINSNKTLPGNIAVERFAEVRALEILALQNAIKSAAAFGSTRTFQSLPRHLRRRAASHNPRRVPKRLRSRAAAEIPASDNVAKLHRKRAKLRAKGSLRGESRTEQLLQRQRSKTWLSTHLWHAKRFHMVNLWGFRLPLTPTLKSFRPSYRAARKRAIVNDASYFGILELQGKRDDLVRLLSGMTSGRFAGSRYETGIRAAITTIYHFGDVPLGLLGPVEILWRPDALPHDERIIWLRLHPSIYDATFSMISSTLLRVEFQQNTSTSSTNVPNPIVQIKDLRKEMDSFEIVGPRSTRVLKRILRLCKSENGEKRKLFGGLSEMEPAELPEGLLFGVLVQDPRLIFPAPSWQEMKVDFAHDGVSRRRVQIEPSISLAESSIWDSEVREKLAVPVFKKSDLDNRRKRAPVPGTPLQVTPNDARIPLLLIKRTIQSPSSSSHALHGLCVLLPRGYSNYFLSSFVYAGCKIGGLAERRVQHREAGVPCFPEHFGNVCKAGSAWEVSQAGETEMRWLRKPPGKRTEWEAVGTRCPWKPDWDFILNCDNQPSSVEEEIVNSPAVKRHGLPQMWLLSDPFLDHIHTIMSSENPAQTLVSLFNAFRIQRSLPKLTASSDNLYRTAVVHVQLDVVDRGSPGDMAAIYALDADARTKWLSALTKDQTWGRAGWEGSMGSEQKSELQKLGEAKPDSNQIMGFTSSGNFSLSRGAGFALGQVTLKSYIELGKIALQRKGESAAPVREGLYVKVKNRDGAISRLAKINLCH